MRLYANGSIIVYIQVSFAILAITGGAIYAIYYYSNIGEGPSYDRQMLTPKPAPTPTPIPETSSSRLNGTLIDGGVECQRFQADNGAYYTLAGDLKGFKTGDRVEIEGQTVEISFCMQDTTIGVTSIRSAQAPPITPIDASTWKTYRNEEYEFEVKYPRDWFIDKSGSSIVTITPLSPDDPKRASSIGLGSILSIAVEKNSLQSILQEFEDSTLEGYSKKQVLVGEDAIKAFALKYRGEYGGETHFLTLIDNGNNTIQLAYIDHYLYQPTFEGILSTFKFIK